MSNVALTIPSQLLESDEWQPDSYRRFLGLHRSGRRFSTGVSHEAGLVYTVESDVIYSLWSVLASYEPPLELTFLLLAEKWKRDTMFASAISFIASNPAYSQIIALGPAVVPLILRDLAREPAFWFDALATITGAQPILPEHAGDIDAMTNDWLSWGAENGLLPERSRCSTRG